MTTLSGPMLPPRSGGLPKQAVVLLHGYGSDGSDLISLGDHWMDTLPDALFVAPNAPQPVPGNPFGFQWFPLDLERADNRTRNLPPAAPVLVGFLEALWEQTGLSAADTLLIGFSQGAMMALHVGLVLAEPPMGVVAFSGAFVPPASFGTSGRVMPPVCLVHGERDGVVSAALSAEADAMLRAAGCDVRYHVSPGIGHGIAPDGLEFATRFIAELAGRR